MVRYGPVGSGNVRQLWQVKFCLGKFGHGMAVRVCFGRFRSVAEWPGTAVMASYGMLRQG